MTNFIEYDLKPTNGRKSFYGKAVVFEYAGMIYLKSYDTLVAQIDTDTNEVTVHGWYSKTTAQHINSFLEKYGFPTMTKKEMEKK